MSKYIDAEKIPWTDLNDGRGGVNVYVTFLEKVARMPAADVVEVRHGRWEELMEHRGAGGILGGKDICVGYACSECGEQSDIMTYYCPNCGASMMDEVTE